MDRVEGRAAVIIFMAFIVIMILIATVSIKSDENDMSHDRYDLSCLSNIDIAKPRAGYLYVFDREIAPIGVTLVIGGITIEIETTEDIEGVDIYIDNELKFTDYTYPYSRLWNEGVTGRHVIRAVEHGGNESDEISLFIFNPFKVGSDVVINEIMSDPEGGDAGNEWIELYNAGDSVKIKGWTISNADGNAIATLPDWFFPNDTYLVVDFGEGDNDNDFSDGNATFYVGSNQAFFDNDGDECALYTGKPSENTILDFVAYCYEGGYNPGIAHDYATKAGIWGEGEYFDPSIDIPPYSRMPNIKEGSSIGRNCYSKDADTPQDWDIDGGKDAFQSTPGMCNVNVFGIMKENVPSSFLPSSFIDKKKWTIMVYMAGDSNLEKEMMDQLNDLEKVGTDNNINIVFLIDGKSLVREVYIDNHGNLQEIDGTKGKTFMGILMKDKNSGYVNWPGGPGRNRRVSLSSIVYAYNRDVDPACIGEQNTGTSALLTSFIDWAVELVPADHYILLMGGHGAGWKGLLPDDTDKDWLYMYELRDALDDADIIGFDVIAFDCCHMSMVEVGYQIRLYTDFMVGSEEYDWGWDYKKIFGHVQSNPNINAEGLANYIVDCYNHPTCGTLSATCLDSTFNSLVEKINDFAINLKTGMEDWGDTENQPFKTHGISNDNCQKDVEDSLGNTEYYGDRNFFDLYDFEDKIGGNAGIYTGYKDGWKEIQSLIKKVVTNEKHWAGHPNSHGLSIYFPEDETYFYSFPDCTGDNSWEYPFDYPWPSRLKDDSSSYAIYAEDFTTEWGKVPYVGNSPHPWPQTPNLLFRDYTQWDEFLHRYYKPCADAGEDQSFEVDDCEKTVAVTLDGSGSSSADDDKKIHRWIWDLDPTKNTDDGDWDKDGIDEANDDNDIEGQIITHNFGVGIYYVTLTVWDDHHLCDKMNPDKTNDHPDEHWKTDQDECIITITCKGDEIPPTVIITDPPDGMEVDENNIVVSGIATDNIGIVEFGYHLRWKDGETSDSWEIDNSTSYEFEFEVELYDGWNEITVYARDGAGNEGNDSVTVYYYPVEDTTPPVTTEEVGQPSWENGYTVIPETLIWLNATDDMSGVNYIYYEVWHEGTKVAEETAYTSNVELCFADYQIYEGTAELRFYAVDNVGNIEEMKVKEHLVQG